MFFPVARRRTLVSSQAHVDGSLVPHIDVNQLPGPRGIPLLGNMLQINIGKVHLILERWAAEYGPVYMFRMGTKPTVAISDPVLCEQILRDRPAGFRRSEKLARILSELRMEGVFAAEGEAWRRQRKLAVHALAQRNLRKQYQHLTTVAGRLKERWDRLADAGDIVDISEDFRRFTVDATTLIAFGYDTNSIERGGNAIRRRLELVFPAFSRRLFALVPLWRAVRSPMDRRLDRAIAELKQWLGDLVVDTRRKLDSDPARGENPSNFLEAMLIARDEHGMPFTNDALFANLMTMLLAGEDTTANTLAWAIHHLCDCPQVVSQLREEADHVFGDLALPADVDMANKLACAGAVADEAMRLRPVAPLMFLDANMDTVIGNLRIPQGTRLAVISRPAAVDPSFFDDPQTFRPQRWLDQPDNARASIPFGSGPRICPGRFLALLEMKLILSMLYRNFDVERVGTAADVKELFAFTMMPVGLKVRFKHRQRGKTEAQ